LPKYKFRTSYKKGYFIELKARDMLLELGATHVVRSSRSLTPVDLIAIFKDRKEIWLIQSKGLREAPKNLDKLRNEFKTLVDLAGDYHVTPYVYMKRNGRYTLIKIG
jgi:hypothetical protein